MKAPDETSPSGPVFVDSSGRRLRRVKLVGLGALGVVAGYVALLLVALIGGPNVAAPYLPLPAAVGTGSLPSSPPPPDAGAPQDAEGPAAVPGAPAALQVPVAAPQPVPAQPPVSAAAVPPAAPAVPAVGAEPAARPTAPGMSGSAPGANDSAPGQATRPSPPAHP